MRLSPTSDDIREIGHRRGGGREGGGFSADTPRDPHRSVRGKLGGAWRERRPRHLTDGEGRIALLFLVPALVGFLFFTGFPIIAAIGLSFFKWNIGVRHHFVGFANFIRLLAIGSPFWGAIRVTAVIAVISVAVSTVVGLAFAQILVSIGGLARKIFQILLYIPVVTPIVADAIVFEVIFQPSGGLANGVQRALGLGHGPDWLENPTFALIAVIILTVWQSWGYAMLLYSAALDDVPAVLIDAASVEGAGPWQRFRNITLPLVSPVTFFVVVLGFINGFQLFAQSYILTKGGPGVSTTTIVVDLYNTAFQDLQIGYAAAMGLVLFVIVVGLTFIQWRLQRRWVFYMGGSRK